MLLPDVLDVGVTVTLVSSPLLLRVCIVWVHICVTRDPSIGGAEEGREGGRREEGGREGGRREGRKEGRKKEKWRVKERAKERKSERGKSINEEL